VLASKRSVVWARSSASDSIGTTPSPSAVYRAICEGVDGVLDRARHAGCKPEEVRSAYERIKYLGRQILEEHRQAEARRMESARRLRRTETSGQLHGVRREVPQLRALVLVVHGQRDTLYGHRARG